MKQSILTTLSTEKIAAQYPLMSRDAIIWLREKVSSLRNPTLMLIRCFIKDKDIVEDILDEFKLGLIKEDLNKVIFTRLKSS